MATYPNRTLLQLRSTLRALKRSGACEGSFKLQYAVDKTLRELSPEHGNSEAHALEAFDDAREELIQGHAETDEEGRLLYRYTETGAVLVQEGEDWLYAERHAEVDADVQAIREEGDRWGGPERAQAEAGQLAYVIDDQEALQEDLDALRAEKTEAQIHAIEPDVLAELDLSGAGRQIDTSVLELMEDT